MESFKPPKARAIYSTERSGSFRKYFTLGARAEIAFLFPVAIPDRTMLPMEEKLKEMKAQQQ